MKYMRNILFLILSIILLIPFSVADGGFFRPNIYYDKDLFEPAQKAIILYDGVTETLIIEATYDGEITDFAWIIPVPAYPDINKTSAYIFEELHYLTQPEYKRAPSAGFGMKNAERMTSSEQGVNVLEQKQVGVYETTLLTSDDPKALINWLNSNNYYVSLESESVLEYYIGKNWYFIAARINLASYDAKLIQSLKNINPSITSTENAETLLTEQLVGYVKSEKEYAELTSIRNVVLDYDNDTDERISDSPHYYDYIRNPKPTNLITEQNYTQIYEKYNGYLYSHILTELSTVFVEKYDYDVQYPEYYQCKYPGTYPNIDISRCDIWLFTEDDPQYKILNGVDCGSYCGLISSTKQEFSIDDLSQVAAYAIVNGDEEVRSYFKIDTTGYDWYDTKEDKQRYIQNLVLSNLQDTKELLKSMAEQNASLAWIKSYSVLTGAPASYDGVVGNIISRTLNDFEANKPYVESYVYTIGFLSYAEYDELKSKYMGDHDDNTLRSNVNSVVRDVLFWKQETVMESLGKGNLQPLAIKFESRDIIYPLKISSVNNGISEVLLYVFAKYKTETKDNDLFEVEYAKWIEKEDIQTASYDAYAKRMGSADEMMRYYYPTTYYYTNQLLDDRYYLTKFRAELWPKEMEDLNFVQSDNNRPYRLVVRSEGYVASWVLFIFGLMVSMVILFGIAMLCRWFNNKFVKSENSLFFVSIRRTVVYTLVLPIILMLMFLFERFAEVFSEVIFENDLFEALGELIEFIMKLFHYLHIPDFISVLFVAIILILMIFYVLHFISTAILSVWRNIGEHGVSGVMDWNKVMRLGLFTAIAVILFLFVLFAFAEALNGKNWLTMFYLTIISVLVVTIPNILWNFVIPRMRSK